MWRFDEACGGKTFNTFGLLAMLACASSCTDLSGDCDLNLTCESYREVCGNGELQIGEECDDGASNSDTKSGACRTTCVLPFCGDGVLDNGESCDRYSANPHLTCAPTCSVVGCLVGTPTFPTIQSAIDDPACTTIVVPSGTYAENMSIARDLELVGIGDKRPVLDGGGSGSVVVVSAGTVVFRDLVVTGGSNNIGGGIQNAGFLTLNGCAINHNSVLGTDGKGGGIYNTGMLTAKATTFTNNNALVGAGIYNSGGDLDLGNVDVANNLIDGASFQTSPSRAAGGGIYSDGGMILLHDATTVQSNFITGNTYKQSNKISIIAEGGGVYATGCEVTIDGAHLLNNEISATLIMAPGEEVFDASARANGAGLVVDNGTLTMRNKATITGNVATASFVSGSMLPFGFVDTIASGGAVVVRSASVLVKDGSVIRENKALATRTSSMNNPLLRVDANGGAFSITSTSTLQLEDSAIEDNLAEGESAFGGAVRMSSGSFIIRRSTVRGNLAHGTANGASGGAVSAYTSIIECENSSIDLNEARGADTGGSARGGAFDVSSGTADNLMMVTLTGCTLSENKAVGASISGGFGTGGALDGDAGTGDAHTTVILVNSTVSGNLAQGSPAGDGTARAGAINLETGTGNAVSTLMLYNTTITQNRTEGATTESGGIRLRRGISTSVTNGSFTNSIIFGNTATIAPDCQTSEVTITCNEKNLIGTADGCALGGNTPMTAVDPLLLPLDKYGGGTLTHALAAGSPVISTSSNCADDAGIKLIVDQRGQPRQGLCDLGAVERQGGDP